MKKKKYWYPKPERVHYLQLARSRRNKMRSLMNYGGPVLEEMSMFSTEFIGSLRVEACDGGFRVMVMAGDSVLAKSKVIPRTGGATADRTFAVRLRKAAASLEKHRIGATETPEHCPNGRHRLDISGVSEPELIPDGPAWRCLGCGWLVGADGKRVHERYGFKDPRPGQKTPVRGGEF